MTSMANTTDKKLVEQALMLTIRFRVLMYQLTPSDTNALRLRAAIDALELQLNAFHPTRWMRENFILASSSFAGHYWSISKNSGLYKVQLSDQPFSTKTQFSLSSMEN
ncbi:hypothetical protein [Shewanella sp.]|uniref:hypothetical protein n=1 Tax=Shewanella sp. TaxID=50422 RepID=UPI003F2C5A1D